MKAVRFWGIVTLAVALGFLLAAKAHAQYQPNSVFLAQTITVGTSSTVIQASPTGQVQRHMIELQNSASSSATVYICIGTHNQCSSANAAFELAPGAVWYVTSGMYTGIGTQQLGNSGIFGGDLSAVAATGSISLRVLID